MKNFILILLLVSSKNHAFFFKTPILVSLEKNWYTVGETVAIFCQSTDTAYRNLYFTRMKSDIPLEKTTANYSLKHVDEYTVILQLFNVTQGKHTYVCQSKNSNKMNLDVGVASFEVGYAPKIKQIYFEFVDFKMLNVFMIPDKNNSNQYWKIKWTIKDNNNEEDLANDCLCLNSSQGCLCENPFHCTISKESCIFPNRTYEFNILGSNRFALINETYTVNLSQEIVKLNELQTLEVLSADSSLTLFWSWKIQELIQSSEIIKCQVSYQTQTGEWKTFFTTKNEMTFANLVPNTKYALNLQCQLQGSEYWSKVIRIQEKTSSPKSLNLSTKNLEVINITETGGILNWTKPNINSNLFYYLVIYKAEDGPEELSVFLPWQEFELKDLKSSTLYMVSVSICDLNNCSKKKSFIQFRTKKLLVQQPLIFYPTDYNEYF